MTTNILIDLISSCHFHNIYKRCNILNIFLDKDIAIYLIYLIFQIKYTHDKSVVMHRADERTFLVRYRLQRFPFWLCKVYRNLYKPFLWGFFLLVNLFFIPKSGNSRYLNISTKTSGIYSSV